MEQNQEKNGAASTTAKSAKEALYTVYDLNQRGDKPRIHLIPTRLFKDGSEPEKKAYSLYSAEDKGCEMPMDHAMRFLVDSSFKVVTPSGTRLKTIERMDLSKPIKSLAADEVIVKYEYLDRNYLYRMAKSTPGSEDIKPNATAEELAKFMTAWRNGLATMSDVEKALAATMAQGELGGAISNDALDKMFPKAA